MGLRLPRLTAANPVPVHDIDQGRSDRMRTLRRIIQSGPARLAAASVIAVVAAAPALAAGPKLATPKQKTLIETSHFGTFYLPRVVTAGRAVVALWRGPNQSGTVRTVATSTDGG